jgi:hypothetical protein
VIQHTKNLENCGARMARADARLQQRQTI